MTRTARRASIAALTAVAALAVIIAADLTPPAAAQSEDETTGRIVARRLDDGRVEFGWQPSGAARVLPRQRYFPTDATVERWLRSSPVEVGGAEIGRINARLLSDGRIEFAFTPTDGERIAPRARYFPADARVGRWLRSTEIAIGPARTGYIAVSTAVVDIGRLSRACAIRENGELTCWGNNEYAIYDEGEWQIVEIGLNDAPEGSFTAVSAGYGHSCAIRASGGAITCWGVRDEATEDPEGSYTAVSVGVGHTCAIRESGELACWGYNAAGQLDAPEGRFTAVSAGSFHTCAIRDTGEIACWGFDGGNGQTDAPEGAFRAVSTSWVNTCAIRTSGEIECWGLDSGNVLTDAPEGSFSAVSAGGRHSCAIRESDSGIACWGDNEHGQTDAPEGSYTAISAGGDYTCALRESGAIECWGWNDDGRATPPTD